jgi:hypothetical protein
LDGLWNFKWCGEVGNALHLAMQANLPLAATTYHVPFCGFTHICYKYNMKLTIPKSKAQCEGQDMLHITLVELN